MLVSVIALFVDDTLLVNESPLTTENGALYQSSAGNTLETARLKPLLLTCFQERVEPLICC
jgi:hypothetical protein